MRRRKYSEEYRDYRQPYSPDISPLEQIARTALELHKLLGVENLDDNYFDSNYRSNESVSDKFYSLCVSKISHRLSESDIRDAIYYECKYCGDFNVKISSYNGERVAYINFRSSSQAAKAYDGLKNFKMDSKSVWIEPLIHNNNNKHNHKNNNNNTDKFISRSPRSIRSRSPVYQRNYDNYPPNNRRCNESHSPIRYNRHRSRSISKHSNNISNRDSKPNYSNKDIASIPTRTLFIGNLPFDVTEIVLREVFRKYGEITEIDIKKPLTNRQSSTYAFIKFENLDIANQAKIEMSGHTIGKCQIKIGFGKVNPTCCVWVGGLGPWILYDTFEKEMSRFGPVKQIDWPHSKNYAYVLYESVDVAITAVNKLRGTHLFDENKPIKVDFADISVMKPISAQKQQSSKKMENKSKNSLKRSVKETPQKSSSDRKTTPVTEELTVHSSKSISQLISCLTDVWTGMIVLKNNNFGCRLSILKGERSIINEFMFSKSGNNGSKGRIENLTITQRMKLDRQKLSEMSQRIEAAGDNGFCLLLASSYIIDTKLISDSSNQPQRPLKNLITYLRTKESAGVIFLKSNRTSLESPSTGVLHAFPPCDFSFEILVQKAPNLTKDFLKDDFLVVLLIRNSV